MALTYKPSGYNSVSPYFVVKDISKLVDLLKQVFHGEELRKYTRPDGSVVHAEVKVDDSVLMMGESSNEFTANQLMIHVYVKDVEATYREAINHGCEEIEKPQVKPGDPDKRGSFYDLDGNYWTVSTQVNPENASSSPNPYV